MLCNGWQLFFPPGSKAFCKLQVPAFQSEACIQNAVKEHVELPGEEGGKRKMPLNALVSDNRQTERIAPCRDDARLKLFEKNLFLRSVIGQADFGRQ
ncbi:hypothetical protein Ppha_2118 [Pelodictyon phaeoclathratiforme BU-1]|jgi:hypothetical protein|uniref:Uncharacterized protein n=1 Tax=Pelodictyon phaeoclathratiforme (strain DSM 5477 / BU-1) TaxID=324925 RepID=B4SD65_PELPB|nr:hypothetical protein Ppha_2118 [Pelodictyon phaeoclathratiforme BU-1]